MLKQRIFATLFVATSINAPMRFAHADNPLDIYIGGAIGDSTIRANEAPFGYPLDYSARHSAWKVLAGLRPIKIVGAELEYINFGHPGGLQNETFTDVRARAEAAFGLLYLPLPVPFLDIYAKAGIARSQIAVNAHAYAACTAVVGPGVPPCVPEYFYYRDRTDVSFAYGAGAQVKLSRFAIRAEYERVDASGGNPDLISLGVTWEF